MKIAPTLATLAVALVAISCASSDMEPDQMATVSGVISYSERIALGPGAVLHVRIVDLDLLDKPGYLVAQEAINGPGQIPIEFELTYWTESVESGHTYALDARIEESGKVIFSTPEALKFDAKQPTRQELLLKAAE